MIVSPSPALIALIILVVVLLLNTLVRLAKRQQLHATDTQRAVLYREITELKREAAQYNTPSTFARSAKCQRQVNAKEKQLALVEAGSGGGASEQWLAKVQQAARIIKIAGAAACALYCFGQPVAYVPPELLLPVQRRLLALPHGAGFSQFGGVAIVPWMLLCERATGVLVQAALPPLPLAVAPPPAQAAPGAAAGGQE